MAGSSLPRLLDRALPEMGLGEMELLPPVPRIVRTTEIAGMLVFALHVPARAVLSNHQLTIAQSEATLDAGNDCWCAPMDEPPLLETTVSREVLAVVPAPDWSGVWRRDEAVEVIVREKDTVIVRQSVLIEPLVLKDLVDDRYRSALADALSAHGKSEISAILRMSVSVEPFESVRHVRVEHVVAVGNGLVVDGCIAARPQHEMAWVTDDLRDWAFPHSIAVRPVPQEETEPYNTRSTPLAPPALAFTAVISNPGGHPRDLYGVEVSEAEQTAVFYGPVPLVASADGMLALELVYRAFGDIRTMEARTIDMVYRPLLSVPKQELGAEFLDLGPSPPVGRPLSSMIIPLCGDPFFLNCVYDLQHVLDESFELILVVDDPGIWGEIHDRLSSRIKALRTPVRLMRNFANYGYSGACNLGVRLARGDVLFFMNSDVLVKNALALSQAAQMIRSRRQSSRPEVVIGFSLLYEDGTIQHMGTEFARASNGEGLFVAESPMKGSLFASYEGEMVRRVPAVAGALMALSNELFASLGGFDPSYERWGFEDADLCLRARRAGAEIEVHVHPGLYHFEHQSVAALASPDVREIINHMNCVQFNKRWATELAKAPRILKLSQPQAAGAAGPARKS